MCRRIENVLRQATGSKRKDIAKLQEIRVMQDWIAIQNDILVLI